MQRARTGPERRGSNSNRSLTVAAPTGASFRAATARERLSYRTRDFRVTTLNQLNIPHRVMFPVARPERATGNCCRGRDEGVPKFRPMARAEALQVLSCAPCNL